jgi:hypothetical protein
MTMRQSSGGRKDRERQGAQREDRELAYQLANKLGGGSTLDPVEPAFRLREGESQIWTFDWAGVYQYFAVDVPYTTIHNAGIHPVGLAIHATVHRAINKSRKAKAEAEAAAQWREVGRGSLHVTTKRLTLDTGGDLTSWWYQSLARIEYASPGVMLVFEDSPGAIFEVAYPLWLYVTLHHLAWGEVPELPTTN